jgi:chromate transport protein ChrA
MPDQANNNNAPPGVMLTEVFWYWLKPGFISFGGSAGQIAIMRRIRDGIISITAVRFKAGILLSASVPWRDW